MSDLIHRPHEKKIIIDIMNDSLHLIPKSLINIINTYSWLPSSVEFIDWTKN